MLSRFFSLLCGGLLLAGLAASASAQAPPVKKIPPLRICSKITSKSLDQLADELSSKDQKVRVRAMELIAYFGNAANDVAPMLVEMAIGSGDSTEALKALVNIDADATKAAVRGIIKESQSRCKSRATDTIVDVGAPVAPHLVALLAEKEYAYSARWILERIGEPALPHVLTGLKDTNTAVRLACCRVVIGLGPKAKGAAPALRQRLDDEQVSVRVRAAVALANLSTAERAETKCFRGTNYGVAMRVLDGALRSRDNAVRSEALTCLQETRCDAPALIPAIMALLMADDAQFHQGSMSVLAVFGQDSMPALIHVLPTSTTKQGERIIYTFRLIGADAHAAIPSLVHLLEGKDTVLATRAAEALANLGPDAKKAIPQLLGALKSKTPSVRRASAETLAGLDPKLAAQTIPSLVEVLTDGNDAEQKSILLLLRSFGPEAKAATSKLIGMMKSGKLDLRMDVADALLHIDPAQIDTTMPTLLEAIQANSKFSRTAMGLLGRVGPGAKAAAPALKAALRKSLQDPEDDRDAGHLVKCMDSIGALSEAMPVLIESLNSSDREQRHSTVYVIQRTLRHKALDALEGALARNELNASPELTNMMTLLRRWKDQASK